MTDNQPQKAYALQTTIGFTAFDGKQFFDLAEARKYVRTAGFTRIIDGSYRDNADFAKLDKDLLVNFLMSYGPQLAKMAQEQFNPAPLPPEPPVVTSDKINIAPVPQAGRPLPTARADASPSATISEKLMGAAQRGLESVQSIRRDPGFPPQTKPVTVEDEALEEILAREMGLKSDPAAIREAMARGFKGA